MSQTVKIFQRWDFLASYIPDLWFPMVTKQLAFTVASVVRVLVLKATNGAGERGRIGPFTKPQCLLFLP